MTSLFWVCLSLKHVENMAGVSIDFSFDSVIRGHHIYKKVWMPSVGEVLLLVKEEGNEHNCFAVSVMKDGFIVGHAPRELSKLFTHFLNHEGEITARITGHKRLGNGLEVPCCYIFSGKKKLVKKLKELILKREKVYLSCPY